VFIESIEGGTYIAGIGDSKPALYLKEKSSNKRRFQCINSIKKLVERQNFDSAILDSLLHGQRGHTPFRFE
jgi:hypothetical protein